MELIAYVIALKCFVFKFGTWRFDMMVVEVLAMQAAVINEIVDFRVFIFLYARSSTDGIHWVRQHFEISDGEGRRSKVGRLSVNDSCFAFEVIIVAGRVRGQRSACILSCVMPCE